MLEKIIKELNIGVAEFGKSLGKSRLTAYRILNGERFSKIGNLFLQIYHVTGATPNQILNIPPKKESEE